MGILGGILIDVYNGIPPATIVYAQEPEAPRVIQIEVRINWTEERIQQEIEEQALQYGHSASYMADLIDCESMGSTTIQSNHAYGFTNAKKGIYKGQATDPAFAINFMAKNLGKVKWYCEDLI